MQVPSLGIAFLAGLVSFLSPCVLPLVPAYIGYMSGSAARQAQTRVVTSREPGRVGVATMPTAMVRWVMLAHALMFVLGLVLVLAAFGGAVSLFKDLYWDNKQWLVPIMGLILIIFGVF